MAEATSVHADEENSDDYSDDSNISQDYFSVDDSG